MRAVDRERILQMRTEGQSLRQIADKLGIGYGTVRARLQNALAKNPTRKSPANTTIKDT